MVDALVIAGAGAALAVVFLQACNSVMRTLRRTRLTRLNCCCGLLHFERDPLQGDEITDDAQAATLYPDEVQNMRRDLRSGLLEQNMNDNNDARSERG